MKRTRFRIIQGAAGLVAVTLLATGCMSSRNASSDSASGSGKTSIVVATSALATSYTFDSAAVGSYANYEVMNNTQATLVRTPFSVKEKQSGVLSQNYSTFEGYLADQDKPYDVSADGLTYTFHLRQDVKSQSGNPLTADDVLYSFERKYNTPTSSANAILKPYFANLSDLKKIDDHTVSFTLTRPSAGYTFLGNISNLNGHIYDSTVLKAHATPDDPYAVKWSQTNTGYGFGPYTVDSVQADQEMVLKANPNYVLGEPKIKTVTIRQVADAGTRASLLRSGDVDIAENLRPADQGALAGSEGITVPSIGQPIEYLDLTQVTNKPPFNDPKVRQAMAYAVPYDEIIKQVYAGRGVKWQGTVNPETKGFSTTGLPKYDYDPAKAKALLAEAGHPDGLEFTLTVQNSAPDVIDAAVLIKSAAADAGIDVTVDQQPDAQFTQGRVGGGFQALMYRNRAQTQSPVYSLTTFWQPNNNTSNPSRFENPEFTALVNQGQTAVADPLSTEAGSYWNKAQKILLDNVPEIAVAYLQPSQAYSSSIKGYSYNTQNVVPFAQLSAGA